MKLLTGVILLLSFSCQEWNSQQPPECDVKGKYYTPVGINLFQIIDQNVHEHLITACLLINPLFTEFCRSRL